MKVGARIAVGIAIGYFLGRTKKMRWAMTMVAAGATGRLTNNPGELLRQGTKLLGATPEVKALTEDMRGRLLEAGKGAAAAAASQQINSLSDRLQHRAETLRGVAVLDRTHEESDEGRESDEDRYDRDEGYDDQGSYEEGNGDSYEEEEDEEEVPRRSSSRRATASRGRRDEQDVADDDYEDENEDEGDADEPPAKPARRSPVRRVARR